VPVQFEGRLVDGRAFYFRYRWGRLWLGAAETFDAAVQDAMVGPVARWGDDLDGSLDQAEVDALFALGLLAL
jgi:hypothetical protein